MELPHTAPAGKPRMVDAALLYARQNIPVFPLRPRGKEPTTANGFKDATTDEATIRAWWKKSPQANIGIPTGAASGWAVLDFDPRNGGDADGVIPDRPALPLTRTTRTGSGGMHRIYQHHPGLTCKTALYAGVDLKAEGGYIVAPPSLHPCGERYTWLTTNDDLATLPAWVIEDRGAQSPQEAPDWRSAYTPPAHHARQEDAQKWITDALHKAATEGSRNAAGFWLAQQLLDNGIPDPEAAILDYAAQTPDKPGDPYTAREAWRSLASAARYPRREPARSQNPVSFFSKRAEKLTQASQEATQGTPEQQPYQSYEFTEMGNRNRLLAAHGDDIRYNDAWGFVAWDGKRWKRDGAELLVRGWIDEMIAEMKTTAAELSRQSAATADPSGSKALGHEAIELMKWAYRSQTDKMVKAVLSLTTYKVVAEVADFDNAPMLFNCANGTIDLRTGQLYAHRRADMLTQLSPISYDPDATAPRWGQFINEIMCGRAEMVAYLQRALGYSMSGATREQVWHLLIGEGENGKGRLIDAISLVMGDYAGKLNASSITLGAHPRTGSEASPDMAALKGKRFVKITETAEGARIDAALIKELSGEDPITARHLNREFFTFQPVLKLWIYSNHEPQTRDTGHAYWRRVRKVPFNFNVREHPDKKDPQLGDKLQAEASGILNWLVVGCLAWQQMGLDAPAFVTAATDAMRASQDMLRTFLVDRCKRDPEGVTPAKDLYLAYKSWADEAGERAVTQNVFGRMLRERGLNTYEAGGRVKYRGLFLIDASEVTDETIKTWDTDTQRSTRSTGENQRSTGTNPENKGADATPVDLVDDYPGLVSRERHIEKTPGKGLQGLQGLQVTSLICPRCGGSDIRDYSGDLRCYVCDEKPIIGPKGDA